MIYIAGENVTENVRWARAFHLGRPGVGTFAIARLFDVPVRLIVPARYLRSGHRHYGTRAWKVRNAPGRRDLPLGQRTIVKLAAVAPYR